MKNIVSILVMAGVNAQFTEPSPAFTTTACSNGASQPGGQNDNCGLAICDSTISGTPTTAQAKSYWMDPMSCQVPVATSETCVSMIEIPQDYFKFMDQQNGCEPSQAPNFEPCQSPPAQSGNTFKVYLAPKTGGDAPVSGNPYDITFTCQVKWGSSPPAPMELMLTVQYGPQSVQNSGGSGGGSNNGGNVTPAQENPGTVSGSDMDTRTSSTGLKCSMEGFVNMVIEITELILSVITMFKEVLATALPTDLAKSLKYAYQGLSGASSWIGYMVAAVYFMAKDLGYDEYMCEAMGYGNVVVEALYVLIDFGASIDQSAPTVAA